MAATATQIEPSGLKEGQRNSEALKVALASLVGSTIEWYDFFLYGTASALVFGDLFFPTFSPVGGNAALVQHHGGRLHRAAARGDHHGPFRRQAGPQDHAG